MKLLVQLGAARVIGTARDYPLAFAARSEVERATKQGIAEFWVLDYEINDSIRDFCARVGKLNRVDAVVCAKSCGASELD